MNAVRATIPSKEVARSVGITTGNYMLKDGFRGYVSNGPRLQAYDPEPIPDKMIEIIYNDRKCYKCGSNDYEKLQVYFAGSVGKCKKCSADFVISSQISETEYVKKFGLK